MTITRDEQGTFWSFLRRRDHKECVASRVRVVRKVSGVRLDLQDHLGPDPTSME